MDAEEFINGIIDDQAALGVEPVDIDVKQVEDDAKAYVSSLIDNYTNFYFDEQFLNKHPKFRKRIEDDIETLVSLRKMRRMDEITQDSLVKAISGNPNNASLYRALTDIQRTILNIQNKIDETTRSLTAFMKGYQMEFDFDTPTDNSDDGSEEVQGEVVTRGTKDFINQMKGDQ